MLLFSSNFASNSVPWHHSQNNFISDNQTWTPWQNGISIKLKLFWLKRVFVNSWCYYILEKSSFSSESTSNLTSSICAVEICDIAALFVPTMAFTDGRNRHDTTIVSSGAHQNPTFEISTDGPNPDDADYGYIDPNTIQPRKQPDGTMHPGIDESGHQTKEGLANQHPPKVAPYKPKRVDVPPVVSNDDLGPDHDPDKSISVEHYAKLARPFGSPLSPQTAPQEPHAEPNSENQLSGNQDYNHLDFRE